MHMVRQTGKAMPIQFCEYVSAQIMDHIRWRDGMGPNPADITHYSNTRVIQPNAYVDEAKRWYCANVGYSSQEEACGSCQMARGCDIREGLRIPTPHNPARLLGLPTRSVPVAPRETPESPSLGQVQGKAPPASRSDVPRKAAPKPAYQDVPTKMMEFK